MRACLKAQGTPHHSSCARVGISHPWGGVEGRGAGERTVGDLASRCESLLVHIFLPLQCWQFRKGDGNVQKEVPVSSLLISAPPCPVLPTPLSPSSWL